MRRGDVAWAELEPRSGSEQRGRRPVVVVSHDSFNQVPTWRSLIVVPLTTSARQAARGSTIVPLAPADTGLRVDSVALCHQITTIDRSKVGEPVARLGEELLQQIGLAILKACDIRL